MKKPIDFNTVGDDDYDGGIGNLSKDGEISVSASTEELRLSNIQFS